MKKAQVILMLAILCFSFNYAQNWQNAHWIWQHQDGPSNSWVSFRKTVQIDAVPETVLANIAVDSRFWLWINGELVVFEGGSSSGPSQAGTWDRKNHFTPTNTWYEELDIACYLKEGENTIAILVWYWGRETHKGTYIDSGKGGLLFQCGIGDQHFDSNRSWKVKQHPAYALESGDTGKSIVQYNVKYNARNDLNDWSDSAWYTNNYKDENWDSAVEKGAVSAGPWYQLEQNYVPRLFDHGLQNYENNEALNFPFVSDGKPIVCKLPFNKQITPYLEVESEAGKIIHITTDNRLNKISAEYTTKTGNQLFESFSWMNGHDVIYTIPAGIKVKALKYRWMSVGEMAGTFETNDAFYNRLWEMGRNTLFVCARDNFMDCPDRERALWIGDVADQTGYLFYSMDNAGRQLLKKAILNTVNFSQDEVIGALGPLRVRELPSQSLQFIAQTIWPYYQNTADLETLEHAYPYVHDYLSLFEMEANGLPKYRVRASPDSWDWNDWGVKETADKEPIQAALYYMALASAKEMAEVLGETSNIAWYEDRMKSTKNAYNQVFWQEGFYSSDTTKFKDDRANTLAVLSGIAEDDKQKAVVKNVLIPIKNSSPHFEWMVEAAMCEAGYYEAALQRMHDQYKTQVNQKGLTTLYEMFPRGGSYNHAWNASNTVLSKYIAGIEPTKVGWSQFQVCPNLGHLSMVKFVVPSIKGAIKVRIDSQKEVFKLAINSPNGTEAIIGIPKINRNIKQVKVGGQVIWKNGKFINGQKGVSWNSEDADFLKFKVAPGNWTFVAEGKQIK
ncbi:alpha-L-rhamnosidase C-terminal domain-containing protein [Formosa sp. PL04]|uniref:alpha-L-rhamnosidase-related protein n=1 Tax=Formosa sp. PL04 TaxID=3081755 RepID=UPI0029810507|nr:alpha-L-rhamnosidase C-terminal domain-containing protein [Formosa sp. PL04]MDW5288137.1 alpha-L-rhamnosidase C-terminal domain-containing protein [Formosa sp. PL04]